MVVVDLSVFGRVANFSPAHSPGFYGVLLSHNPVGDVEIVNVLLDIVITGKPGEVVPIPNLVFEFALAFHARFSGAGRAVPQRTDRADFSDSSILDALDPFLVAWLVAALQTDGNLEVFRLGGFASFDDSLDSVHITGDGLFHEDVFSLSDGFFKMLGTKTGRGCENDDIAFGNDALVAFEIGVFPVLRNINSTRLVLFKNIPGLVHDFTINIAHGMQRNFVVCC